LLTCHQTTQHAACEHNQNVVARALVLGYQVAVNAQSKQRKTPLHLGTNERLSVCGV
jgi:hypothetical protein